jgi:hypothetical protein
VLGGLTPLVATWMSQRTCDDLTSAYYLMAAALMSLVMAVSLPKTTKAEV